MTCPCCIEAASNLLAEKLAVAPPAVVEAIVYDVSLYLTDANGTVYLVWDPPEDSRRVTVYYEDEARPVDAIPLYRLTALPEVEEPAPVVDLMAAIEESLAAARRTLGDRS